jgi:dihydroorotate dehydrogenase (fumarate)
MDLSTSYLGFRLSHPVLPGAANPLSKDIGTIKALEDAGAPAIVLYSLFEEQIQYEEERLEHFLEYGAESHQEATSYFPTPHEFKQGAELYPEYIRQVKAAVGIPVIASLNGHTPGGWTSHAKLIEQAGADALELNLYFVQTGFDTTAQAIEDSYVEILRQVRQAVSIPVAVKLSPFFTCFAHFASRLDEAGADGLVLFNRFYQPDINLEALEVEPALALSSPWEMRLPLRWIAILYSHLKADLSATSGVQTGTDALKLVMAGASTVQVVSSLLREGPGLLQRITGEMAQWLETHEYDSLEQARGSMSQKSCPDPAAFERANYMRTLKSYK